jgi:hypothetical protein
MTGAPAAAVPVLPERPADPEALAECADEIIEKLAQASAPVILVDVEVRRYALEHRVTALARKIGLPVVTTFMGRGLLQDAPDVLVGTYLGAAGDPTITRLVEDADALLLLGVILSDTNFALSQRRLDPRRTMLAFDRAVRVGHHLYPDVPIAHLIDALVDRARPLGAGEARVNRPVIEYARGLQADDHPIDPSDVATAINDLRRDLANARALRIGVQGGAGVGAVMNCLIRLSPQSVPRSVQGEMSSANGPSSPEGRLFSLLPFAIFHESTEQIFPDCANPCTRFDPSALLTFAIILDANCFTSAIRDGRRGDRVSLAFAHSCCCICSRPLLAQSV